MEIITVDQAREDLIKMFDIREFGNKEAGKSFRADDTYYIDKREAPYAVVVGKLREYFSERKLADGYAIRIEPQILLYTTVQIGKVDDISKPADLLG